MRFMLCLNFIFLPVPEGYPCQHPASLLLTLLVTSGSSHSHVAALGQSEVIKPALTMSRSPDYSAIVKVNRLVEKKKKKKPCKNMPYFRKIEGRCLLQLAHTNLRYTQ